MVHRYRSPFDLENLSWCIFTALQRRSVTGTYRMSAVSPVDSNALSHDHCMFLSQVFRISAKRPNSVGNESPESSLLIKLLDAPEA